jgi:hypothetical protein
MHMTGNCPNFVLSVALTGESLMDATPNGISLT